MEMALFLAVYSILIFFSFPGGERRKDLAAISVAVQGGSLVLGDIVESSVTDCTAKFGGRRKREFDFGDEGGADTRTRGQMPHLEDQFRGGHVMMMMMRDIN
jgi:hypothetical protein